MVTLRLCASVRPLLPDLKTSVLLACGLLLTPVGADAATVTYTFTGTVTSVDSSLTGLFNTSMPLSGRFTYETNTPGVLCGGCSETVGYSDYAGAVTDFVMTIGGYTASPPFGTGLFSGMQVVNNWHGFEGFNIVSRLSGTQINGFNPLGALFFYTTDLDAVSDTKLVNLGDLTGWTSTHSGASWYMAFDCCGGSPRVHGVLTSLVQQPSELTVRIDIKPGNDPNALSMSDQGLVPVAIIGGSAFDVTLIDPSTLELAGVDIALRGSAKRPSLACAFEDVNGDGLQDLVAFFQVPALVQVGALTNSTIAMSLTGRLTNGTLFQGADSVKVVP